MQLDISVFTNLQEVTSDYPYNFKAYNQPDFHNSCTAFDGYYTGAKVFDFNLSYSTYNYYRKKLARLAGYEAVAAWHDPDKYEKELFFKQVNYSDFEGCIDFPTADQLYKEYLRYWPAAVLEWNDPYLEIYLKFLHAFKFAAEHKGVVLFN
jgi:hypothetical protein